MDNTAQSLDSQPLTSIPGLMIVFRDVTRVLWSSLEGSSSSNLPFASEAALQTHRKV